MIKLELDDSRRLTGKGMLWDLPGAVIDAFVDGIDKTKVVECWQKQVRNLLDAVNWPNEQTTFRIFEDGVTLALSAPFDALYAATEINEAAWNLTCDELQTQSANTPKPTEALTASLLQMIADEVNPTLLALITKADALNVAWLTDDDEFSLGFGKTVQIWPANELPTVDEVDWTKYARIPVAMITGTNGKSTSVRLASEIIKQSGQCCGVTSTDFIRVGETIIDKGDYSGPGGARTLLRHKEVEVALLEVARGGILRRGLPIPDVDVALITNVAEDHLGQYGINTLDGLIETKFVVAKGVTNKGILVLNADDAGVVKFGATINKTKCWFSCDQQNPVLVEHLASGGAICYVRDGKMVYQNTEGASDIVAVNDVPMTFNGAATHNVQNALGAIGVGKGLNISDEDIGKALGKFRSDAADNPGRGNVFNVKGATVVMDFAHNEHSMNAIVSTTNNMPSKRKWLMMSAGGDRADEDISVMIEAGMLMKPDKVVSAELKTYLRGRPEGEIPALCAKIAKNHGMSDDDILTAGSPTDAAKLIIEQLEKGDLALLLVLSERDEVVALIEQYQ
jgi:cyanophycin synthetase